MSAPPRPTGVHARNVARDSAADSGDVRRFCSAYAVSALGSGIGSGALPLVAIMVVDASDWQVSLLAVLSGLAGVAVAVPLGPFIEFHRKRPSMITADLARFAALASIPAAALLGVLTYTQLCVVAVVLTAGMIVSNAASQPYLKALTLPGEWTRVNSRLASMSWAGETIGPPIGGVLVSAISPVTSVLVDAVSYLLAACGWRRIRQPEPAPPQPDGPRRWLADTVAGWHYILTHPTLRALFANAMVFGGCVMASSPLIAVYLLRDLHFSALQYGIALGVPCAAGMLGSLLSAAVVRRFGLGRTLLVASAARCLWMAPILLAGPTTGGLVLIIAADSALLLCAGIFNPAFTTYRMAVTADSHLSRVVGAWAMSSKLVQPACIAAAGLLAAAAGIRTALGALSVVLLTCAVMLPWTALRHHSDTTDPVRHPGRPDAHPSTATRTTAPRRKRRGLLQRIAILGAGGAGKTILARQLGQLLGLPVTHLDALRYDPDWNLVPESEFTAAQRHLAAGESWICDGNSLASLPIRAARADTIIVLDPHPLVCLAGILRRRLRYRGGQHADGVYDRISLDVVTYVLRYRRRHLPMVLAVARAHGGHADLIHLTSRRAANRLIAHLSGRAQARP